MILNPKNPPPKHIYNSIEELSSDPKFAGVKKYGASGTPRCLGTVHDVTGACGVDYRSLVTAGYDDATMRLNGENDAIVDSWNWKDAANNTDEIDVLYDRERDGDEVLQKLLENMPMYAVIGLGSAAEAKVMYQGTPGYISKDNPRRARHTVVNMGYLTDGTPIIYDLTKFKKGIQKKNLKEINYIAVPKGGANTTYATLTGKSPVNSKEYIQEQQTVFSISKI